MICRGAPVLSVALLGGLLLPSGAVQAACQARRLDAGLGMASSRWQETSASGERLLSEDGHLRSLSLGAVGQCGEVDWGLSLGGQGGTRDYEGHSTTGAPLRTISRDRDLRVEAEAWWAGTGKASEAASTAPGALSWSWCARAGWEPDSRRELVGVGAVQGYTEHRERWRFGVGVRARHGLVEGWSGTWQAWLDTGPKARLKLAGAAFGEQEVRLSEGRWHALGLAFTARPEAVPGRWQPWIGGRWERLDSRASAPVAILMPSGRVLAVSQPAYRQGAWQLSAGLSLALD